MPGKLNGKNPLKFLNVEKTTKESKDILKVLEHSKKKGVIVIIQEWQFLITVESLKEVVKILINLKRYMQPEIPIKVYV